MNDMPRAASLCLLGLVFACGGRTAFQQTGGSAGGRETGSDPSSPAAAGSAGLQETGSTAGSRETGGIAGAREVGGSAGAQPTSGGARGFWLPRAGFDEVSFDVTDSIRSFAVDASGNVYWASESKVDSTVNFAFTRLSADGRVTWTQQLSGTSTWLGVDDAGTIYQLRNVNQVAVVDKRSSQGQWLWSREFAEAGPDSSSLRLGRDGALYVGTGWGEHLWKLDSDGNVLWAWNGAGGLGVASFAADANGMVYVRTRVKPEAKLPSGSKGQNDPVDGVLWTLDQGGNALSQRRYTTGFQGTSGSVIYLETGPVNFAVTAGGQLLSVSSTSAGLFDVAGDARWTRGAADLNPALTAYSLTGVLSAGRCGYCIASYRGLYAFDTAGKQTESLLLNDDQASASSWASDQIDNIYVLVRDDETLTSALRRYHGASGWENSGSPR